MPHDIRRKRGIADITGLAALVRPVEDDPSRRCSRSLSPTDFAIPLHMRQEILGLIRLITELRPQPPPALV
jgi:hypothetical protein